MLGYIHKKISIVKGEKVALSNSPFFMPDLNKFSAHGTT